MDCIEHVAHNRVSRSKYNYARTRSLTPKAERRTEGPDAFRTWGNVVLDVAVTGVVSDREDSDERV